MFATKCKNETCKFTFTVGSVNMLNFLKLSMLCDKCEKCKSNLTPTHYIQK